MAELDEVVVSGYDPFNYSGDAASEFLRQYGLLLQQAQQPAPFTGFAPPVPVELPPAPKLPNFEEIPVTTKKVSVPLRILTGAAELLAAPLLLLMDSPSDYGLEWPGAPPGGGGGAPPIGEDPIMPPNWEDLARPTTKPGPGVPRNPMLDDDVPELPEFTVQPPRVTPRDPFTFIEVTPSGPEVFGNPFLGSPGSGLEPAPVSTPGSDPVPGTADPLPDPWRRPGTEPVGVPAPDLFGAPSFDPFADPFGYPFPSPREPEAPRDVPRPTGTPTRPTPRAPLDPVFVANPLDPFVTPFAPPQIDPVLVQFGPEPLDPTSETCACAPKKPKRKSPTERTECYRGTYTQRKRGITFVPKEQVPCEKKARAGDASTGSPSKSERSARKRAAPRGKTGNASKRGRSPSLGDLARDVFGTFF